MENTEVSKYSNPIAYLKIFFRRKWFFITPVFFGIVLSIVALSIIPPTFESQAVILVNEEKIINPLIQGLAVSTSVSQRIRTIKEQILSWNSLVELTKKLNLDKNSNSQADFEALIIRLRDNIMVSMRGTNIIRLAYQGKDPAETQIITKTLTDIFIEENMRIQTKETDVAIEFIKDQLKLYKRKIKETEVARLEEQLKTLLQDSTEQHPMVRELRQKIRIARQELDTGDYKVSGVELPANSPLYATIKKEIDKITGEVESGIAQAADPAGAQHDPNQSIYKLLLMDKLDTVVARDMGVNENIYNMLLQKLETAKITQRLETSKEGTRYSIIDPPRLPLKPVKPNKFMVIFIGLFLGGFSGVGMVLGAEFMDHSFIDIDDAKQHLAIPILGAISRITTHEEIEKEQSKTKLTITFFVLVSIALIIVTMLVSLLRK